MNDRTMNNRLSLFSPLLAIALLAGCSSPPAPPPLAGAKIGGPFTLTDQDGKRVRNRDFHGKFRIIYFGYTYCPDICPRDVLTIAQGLRLLEKSDPALAAQIVPIFISVDPARDTPAVLKQFVGAFHPRMVGLTGTPAEIATVAREFSITYQLQPKDASGGYRVDHSRVAFLFGKNGEPLALLRQDGTPDEVAADLKQWAR